METYVTLVTGTGKPGAMEAASKAIADSGCRQVATYMLMGEYDVLVIIEAPDAMTAASAIWSAREAAGNDDSRTQTMRAFTQAEMAQLRQKITTA